MIYVCFVLYALIALAQIVMCYTAGMAAQSLAIFHLITVGPIYTLLRRQYSPLSFQSLWYIY